MGSIGTMEIVLILVVALLLFGPQKLPELGKSLGKTIREFKKASSELRDTLEREVEEVKRSEEISQKEAKPIESENAPEKSGPTGPDTQP